MTPPMASPRRLVLVDGTAMIYRAYFAIPGHLSTAFGLHTNAIYGFATMFQKLFAQRKPDFGAVVFDAPGKTFRDEQYEDYKADRAPMEDKLKAQLPWITRLVEAQNFHILKVPGYEADDVIGTLTKQARAEGIEVLIVSADKDFSQLIDDDVKMFDPMRDVTYDAVLVKKKWGVPPSQFVDLLALLGDKIDNIPGVPGIGKKGAADLLTKYGSLDATLEHLDELSTRYKNALTEHREDAKLSQQLATIDQAVPLEETVEDLVLEAPSVEVLNALYRELEFYSLLEGEDLPDVDAKKIEIVEDVASLVEALHAAKDVAVAAIHEKPSAIVGAWVGAAFSFDDRVVYVPLDDDRINALAPWFASDVPKVTHDAKSLWHLVRRAGHPLNGVVFDTMLASYLVDPVASIPHRLEQLVKVHLHRTLSPVKRIIGAGKSEKRFAEVAVDELAPYAAEIVGAIRETWPKLTKRIDEEGHAEKLTNTELPLSFVLGRLEADGVLIDVEDLERIGAELAERLAELEKRIYVIAGEEFNVASTKQLSHILFEKLELPVIKRTKTGYSTAVDVLERLAKKHEIAALLIDHRKVSKLISTYTNVLVEAVDPTTKRVHASYQQTVATTGRIISTDPDLQRTPTKTEDGKRIRRAFIAPEGHELISADWSQIELRILAHVSEDEHLIEAFTTETDIHRRTAAQLFEVAPEDVDETQRRVGKTVNFATIYGQGATALGQILDVPRKEAERYIAAYFEYYAGVRSWLDATMERAEEDGFVTTLFGRRRYIPELSSNNVMDRQTGLRMAANTPIQGSAADIMKQTMLDLARALEAESLASRMVLQIHDEIVFESPESEVDRVGSLAREKMQSVVSLRVPLVVDVGVGATWADAH